MIIKTTLITMAKRLKELREELNAGSFNYIGKSISFLLTITITIFIEAYESLIQYDGNLKYSIKKTTFSLCYLSPDGENGHPSNLVVSVTYQLTAEKNLIIQYSIKYR